MPALLLDQLKVLAKKLPDTPGVYEFRGTDGDLLYIGKSKNIRKRVLSHISKGYLNDRNVYIADQIASISAHETAGELGALLLELWRIKREMPLYNKRSRKTKLLVILFEKEDQGLKSVLIERVPEIDPDKHGKVLGVFRSVRKAKAFLEYIQKESNLCPKVLGIENGKGGCFYRSLGKCKGVCLGKESKEEHNARFDKAFERTRIMTWPFEKPLTLTESREGFKEKFIIDKWCLKKALKGTSVEKQPFFGETISSFFDYDVYQVLFPFIQRRFKGSF